MLKPTERLTIIRWGIHIHIDDAQWIEEKIAHFSTLLIKEHDAIERKDWLEMSSAMAQRKYLYDMVKEFLRGITTNTQYANNALKKIFGNIAAGEDTVVADIDDRDIIG